MWTSTKIFISLHLVLSMALAQNQKKDERGLIPELHTEQNDQDSENKNLKSEVLISRTETKAIEALQNILKKKKGTPQEADYLNRLAELYMRKSKSGRFFDLQRDTKNKTLSSFPLPEERGFEAIKKALSIYNQIINNFPSFEEYDSVLFNSAFALQQLNQKKLSENNYKKLIEKYPNSKLITDSLLALGELLYEQGNFSQAQIYFQKIENFPDSKVFSYGIYKLAWTYYNLKKSDQAILKLKAVISKNPATDEAINKKGYYLRKEALRDLVLFIGETYQANELYSQFKKVTSDGELGQAMYEMANLYNAYSKPKDIQIFLTEFIEKEEKNEFIVKCHLILADTYETLKKRDLVIEHFSKAANLCQVGSSWRAHQTEEEIKISCHTEFRKNSLEIARKWWEIWQKNKTHKEFSTLTEKILRLVLANENYEEPDLKTRMALAELLFQNEDFEDASENFNIVALKTNDKAVQHEATYSALFSKEKSLEKTKSDLKLAQRKELVQRYLKLFPQGEYANSVGFKLAVIFYEEKNFEESLKTLIPLSQNKNYLEIKNKSEDLILDIKNIEKKYSEVKTLSKVYADATPDLQRKKLLLKINEESHFFEIQEENKQGDKISAAYRLYSYFKSHPASELGKKAFLDSLTIFFKEQYFVDATEKGIEFLNYFPKYDKKMDLEKEIIASLIEIGSLEKASELLIDLSTQDPNKKQNHLQNAADLLIIENKNAQARKLYNQLLLSTSKENRPEIFLKIKNSLNPADDKTEIDKIDKIILEQNVEPFATAQLTKKAQTLYDEKKYPECYDLTLKILKRETESSHRAMARYLQGLIFEKELFNQSVKTSNEEKLGLIIQLKTERLDKAQTAYLSVSKMTTDKNLLIKSLEGIDRCLNNYIQSLNELTPPSSLSANDQLELKKELAKLISPLTQKRMDYLKELSQIREGFSSPTSTWSGLTEKDIPPVNLQKKLIHNFQPLFFDTWPPNKNPLNSSKEQNISLPAIKILLNNSTTRNQGLYALSLFSETENKPLKTSWIIEKLRTNDKDNLNIYNYALFRNLNHPSSEPRWEEKEGSSSAFLKSNSLDFQFFQLFRDYKNMNYFSSTENCKFILTFKNLLNSKSLLEYLLPICSDSFAHQGDYENAEKILSSLSTKDWKNKEFYYLSVARIHDVYKNSSESSIKFYELAHKESSSTDMKSWIAKKVEYLKQGKQ